MHPAACLAVLGALVLAGCGQRADEQAAITGATTLTVYASLPFQGPAGPESESTADGMRLALREAGGMAGELVVKLSILDDSTPKAGRWDPVQAAENARQVARDRTAIAYLGDGPSGATAISLPILNSAGVPQVSPTSAYAGLTVAEGADKGEPEKYYPAGVRSLVRPVVNDVVQARALRAAIDAAECSRLRVLEDRDIAGRGLGGALARQAELDGLEVTRREALRSDVDVERLAADVAEQDEDCVVFTGALADWVPPLYDALHAAAPAVRLFGSSGLASNDFAAALSPGTQARTTLTGPVGTLEPTSAMKRFSTGFREVFGTAPRTGAVYGYEAMRLVLAAMTAAGSEGANRASVMRELFRLEERTGPLGRYAITATGDTNSRRYTRYGLAGGRLVRERTDRFG